MSDERGAAGDPDGGAGGDALGGEASPPADVAVPAGAYPENIPPEWAALCERGAMAIAAAFPGLYRPWDLMPESARRHLRKVAAVVVLEVA